MAVEPDELLDTVACRRAENAGRGYAGPEGSRRGLLNLLNLGTLGPCADNHSPGGTPCPTTARPVHGRQRMGTGGSTRSAATRRDQRERIGSKTSPIPPPRATDRLPRPAFRARIRTSAQNHLQAFGQGLGGLATGNLLWCHVGNSCRLDYHQMRFMIAWEEHDRPDQTAG